MPTLHKVLDVHSCCGFVTDLRAASAAIAILAIVTSPVVSWIVIRHSYVIRVACYISTGDKRADVVDLTLNNIISFGFGLNAGLGPSCLSEISTENAMQKKGLLKFVKIFGWGVLIFDILLVIAAFNLLLRIFKNPSARSALQFMVCTFIALLYSCIYGILYAICCSTLGGDFPVLELFFSIFDLALWCYFIVVVNAYRRTIPGGGAAS